jgi:hypothetical protein
MCRTRIALALGASMMTLLATDCVVAQGAADQDVCRRYEGEWKPPDRAAWTKICLTGQILLRDVESGGDLKRLSATERADISLGSQFIREILTKNPYRDQVRTKGLVIKGAIFADALRLNDLIVDSPLSFVNCEFMQVVDLRRSHFSLSVSLTGSFLSRGLDAAESVLDGSLVLGGTDKDRPAKVPPAAIIHFIDAHGSRIAGDLNIRYADVAGTINLTAVRTGGSVNIMYLKARETVLAASEIHVQLAIVDSTLVPRPTTTDKGGPPHTLLNLNFVHVLQDVFLNRTIALGPIDLQGADIGGQLGLVGGEFGSMNARGAIVKGAMRVAYDQPAPDPAKHRKVWASGAALDLTNASIGTITTQPSLDGWPESLALTNAKIGGFDFSLQNNPGQTKDSGSDWFKKWLARQTAIQPYNHVRTVLAAAGDDATAADVGYAGRDRELIESLRHWELPNTLYLVLSKVMIGYGYSMWLTIVWAIVFVSIGTVVFKHSREGINEPPLRLDALFYSIDMFLPIIEFRKHHRDIDVTSNARFYFYLHKLVGWLVSSFIVAGLAGFTK